MNKLKLLLFGIKSKRGTFFDEPIKFRTYGNNRMSMQKWYQKYSVSSQWVDPNIKNNARNIMEQWYKN